MCKNVFVERKLFVLLPIYLTYGRSMFCSDSSRQDLGLLTYEQNKQKTQKRVKNSSFKKEKQEKEKKKEKKERTETNNKM